jgi:hypothetical protein
VIVSLRKEIQQCDTIDNQMRGSSDAGEAAERAAHAGRLTPAVIPMG